MSDDPFNATLTYREDLTPELAVVRLRPDRGPLPVFEPGQFCTLGLPPTPEELAALPPRPEVPGRPGRVRLVRRAYSIASPPSCRDHLELLIVLVQRGRLTPRIWTIEEGGRLYLDPRITGHFTLSRIPPGQELVAIATGTGVAPFMSMLRQHRADAGRPRPWRRFVLIHGVRNVADLAYRAELDALARGDSALIYIPTVTREPANSPWPGHRGRVQSVLTNGSYADAVGAPLDPQHCHVLLCGNPEMIKDLQDLLQPRGFRASDPRSPGPGAAAAGVGNLHFERYW